ncbi:MAG: AAA domain-containing protein [Bacteroidota bacterium]
MAPAPHLNQSLSSDTPLVNLFGYIRDLFTTAKSSLRYDGEQNQGAWSLHELSQLNSSSLLSCQWVNPARPVLSIRRGESISVPKLPEDLQAWVTIEQHASQLPQIHPVSKRTVNFEDSATRIQTYRQFFQQVHGKELEHVQHVQIPSVIERWTQVSVVDGKVLLSKNDTGEERFEESELRQELLLAYKRSLLSCQEESANLFQINHTYDALHDLFYALKAKPDRQICLSFGLVSGKIGGKIYRNFLFHIPLKLSLHKQTLSLEADTLAHVISCEQSFTDLLDTHFAGEPEEKIRERKLRVLQEVDQFNTHSREFNFDPAYLRGTFYETAIKILEVFPRVQDRFFVNHRLNFLPSEWKEQKELTLSFSPTIQLRDLTSGVLVAQDADKIIAKINELGSQGRNEQIPDFFKKLFSLRRPGNPLRIAYRVENKNISAPTIQETIPERFLFPLPYNQEQLSIAQQLMEQDAVTVQGPPGTGKSHTIANLASHFVAEGKSILIVSKNAKALEVIKKKLPPAIRNLAVALLEGTKNQEELKHAIDAVKNHLSMSYDPQEIVRLEEELEELELQIEEIKGDLLLRIQSNQANYEIYDPVRGHTHLASLAEWVDRWQSLDAENLLIPDSIHHGTDTEGWVEELMREDILTAHESILPSLDVGQFGSLDPESLDDAFLERLRYFVDLQAVIAPYQNILRHPRFDEEELASIWEEQASLCEAIDARSRELLSVTIHLGELEGEDPENLLEELLALLPKYNAQGKLGLLTKKLLPAKQRLLLGGMINQRPIRGREDLEWVKKKVECDAWTKQLGIVLDNYLQRFGIPGNGVAVVNIYREWEQLLEQLEASDTIRQEILDRQMDPETVIRQSAVYIDGLKAYRQYHELLRSSRMIWKKYESVLPVFVSQLRQQEWQRLDRSALEEAIFGRKLASVLEEGLAELGNPNHLLSQMQVLRKQAETLTSQLVAEKTWQRKQASVTDQQRASLTAWRNDLINIGKGYGKNTERNMSSAITNMQLAREVVPIWIMQQQTAISFFPDPEPGQFDLLIVDEASQCDISMLNLIFRCKKCIIVGDENQTSVATQARLFPIARTNQLLDRYLVNHPFRQQFNVNNRSSSIYTLSGVIYPNIISLREHFRCRPELIGFSNQYVYDNHIIPLRTAANNLYGSATEVFYVEDSPENPSKPAMIKAVIDLLKGLIEDQQAGHLPGLPTVGILCLESSNEAHRDMLIRELGRHPLIKTYGEELDLLVGTSREFQGDERDIMILTTTASHKFGTDGKIKAPRAVMGEEMMRIYNVAASRARDKAILIHSIHPEALARMNPACYRKRLIEYFSVDRSSQKIDQRKEPGYMHPSTGQAGKDLHVWLSESYEVSELHPQYKIGPYGIDLAIIREGQKLALFIDGSKKRNHEALSEALRQQMVLERAGWKCYRVQALEWNIQKEKVKEDLSVWLGRILD